MANSNNRSVDFIAVFLVGNRMTSKPLSEVIKNRDNPSWLQALGLPSGFRIPFVTEEGQESVVYKLKAVPSDLYQPFIQDKECPEKDIEDGDYLKFKDPTSQHSLHVLMMSTNRISCGYQKVRLEPGTIVSFGRMPVNDIQYEGSDYISRDKHLVIHVDNHQKAAVEDLRRTVGVYVNGVRTHSQNLKMFDEIFVMGCSMVYMGDYLAVSNGANILSLQPQVEFRLKEPAEITDIKPFTPTPRIMKSLTQEEIDIDFPPAPQREDKTPALLVLGPSVTMASVMLASVSISLSNAVAGGNTAAIVSSSMMAVGMLAGSLLWPSLLRRYQKKKQKEDEEYRQTRYRAYISEIQENLETKNTRDGRILNERLSPAPVQLCRILDNEKSRLRLWERSAEDEDFLDIRLGIGVRPSSLTIKTGKTGFQLYEDELRDLPKNLHARYSILENAPLVIDLLENQSIGLIGTKKRMEAVLHEMILNIISLHPYDEVKLVLALPPEQAKNFEAFKNVPHIWSNDRRIRFYATNTEEVHFIFNAVDEQLKDRENPENRGQMPLPHYVLIATDPSLVEREALLRYSKITGNTVGLTTIFAYGDITRIPKSCTTIIQSDASQSGFYMKNRNENKFIPFAPDIVDFHAIHQFSRALSSLPVKRDAKSLGIADRISFLQMYHAGNIDELSIEEHWENNNSAKSLAAPIGVMAGGEVFSLDIHEAYHGSHGLVAGTTGSGKSEFLQAYILSLAIHYSPKEVSFVLVDFKGGDMARPFMAKSFSPQLPHLAATISNLSGNVLYRALVSLDAEIRFRQKLLNESALSLGVDKLDINSYHKYFKGGRLQTPLPHLIIIIDEFAQLKSQQPEFLSQLINVAQVGRSLGIHLILATQKPGGIVDPQIMSNSRFKVCLKVADKQDSMEMTGKADAAYIRNPGRLFLQVGYDEIYEQIQSGYSGADYIPAKTYMPDDAITVLMTDNTANPVHSAKLDLTDGIAAKTDKTQLEAIVSQIVSLGQQKHLSVRPLWQEMLSERIFLSQLKPASKGICTATVALADHVRIQEQKPIHIDFVKTGHLAVYGTSGTGKTTFLHTLVYSMVCQYGYTPQELNIYALDFGGRNLSDLALLPHTGGVALADEREKIEEILFILRQMIDERKQLFAAHHTASFADYRAVSDRPLPAVLVLLDNYAGLHEKYFDLSEDLLEIIGAGSTFGIYFVITGSTRNAIYYKAVEYISTRFVFKMNDPSNYLDILNMRTPVIPEEISGRGITVIDKEVIEFQSALAGEDQPESVRMDSIFEEYRKLAQEYRGTYRPIRIGEDNLAEQSESGDLYETSTSASRADTYSKNKNDAPSPVPDDDNHLILGRSRSGAVAYGINLEEDFKACICAPSTEHLKRYYKNLLNQITKGNTENLEVVFVDGISCRFEEIVEQFPQCRYISVDQELDSFIEKLKPELNDRLEFKEEYDLKRIIIFGEFGEFFEDMSDEQAAFFRKVMQYMNEPAYGICFITGFATESPKLNDRLYLSLLVDAKNYILLGGCYPQALEKIENLPLIQNPNPQRDYLCIKNKIAEIGEA